MCYRPCAQAGRDRELKGGHWAREAREMICCLPGSRLDSAFPRSLLCWLYLQPEYWVWCRVPFEGACVHQISIRGLKLQNGGEDERSPPTPRFAVSLRRAWRGPSSPLSFYLGLQQSCLVCMPHPDLFVTQLCLKKSSSVEAAAGLFTAGCLLGFHSPCPPPARPVTFLCWTLVTVATSQGRVYTFNLFWKKSPQAPWACVGSPRMPGYI